MDQLLAKKTIKSAFWTYLSYFLSSASVLVTTIILTRLISQEEYGIVGFVLTAMAFLDAIRDLGIGPALVQRSSKNLRLAADTAFWTSLFSNGIMWFVALALTPLIADFFREPVLLQIMPIVALTFIINGAGATHDALLQREMSFNVRAIPEVSASLVKGVVSIGLALMGWDEWALVFGLLAGRFAFTVGVWLVLEWRPRFRFNWTIARQLLQYGYNISIDSLINALQDNIDYVLIGRLLGEVALGLYSVAFRVPELIIVSFSEVLADVLFPAYSSINENIDQLRSAVLTILRYISILLVPAGIGLAIVSPLAAEALFDPEWANAGPVMAALAIYSTLLAISWNFGDVYKAIGRADILWKTAFFEFTLLAPTLYFAAQDSALAVGIGHACVAFVVSVTRLILAIHVLKLSYRHTFAQFIPSAIGVLLMAPTVLLVMALTDDWLPMLSLVLSIASGGFVYILAMWFLERAVFLQIIESIRWRISRGDDDDDEIELEMPDEIISKPIV